MVRSDKADLKKSGASDGVRRLIIELMIIRVKRNPRTFTLLAAVLLGLADVGLVAELGHLLGLGEEFLGLVGISLLDFHNKQKIIQMQVVEIPRSEDRVH